VPVSDQTRPLSMAEAERVPAAQPYRDDAPNVVVIVLMLIVFTVALFLRAPGAKKPGGRK